MKNKRRPFRTVY